MAKRPIPTVYAIVGPTAAGKTAVSIRLAKKVGGEIISGDSRQVYRGLDLGTGKVTKREMRGVPHHLIDVANPRTVYSASDYVRDGRQAIEGVLARGKVPIIVGGTGFYIDALLGRIELAHVEPNQALRKKLERLSLIQLQSRLTRLDPERYATIDDKNPRRLIRAIEIALGTPTRTPPPARHVHIIWIGLTVPFDELREKIHKRLVTRMKAGMVAEVKRLHKNGLSWKLMHALGLEYRYLALYLQKKISKREMLKELEHEIVRYAKRQMTWFKKNQNITWVSPQEARRTLDNAEGRSPFLHRAHSHTGTRVRRSPRGTDRSR